MNGMRQLATDKDVIASGANLKRSMIHLFVEYEAPVFSLQGCNLRETVIGAYSGFSQETTVNCSTVGRYCSIGGEVIIGPGDHPLDRLTSSTLTYMPGDQTYETSPFGWYKPAQRHEPWRSSIQPTEIGHDVFIGTRAIIMGGVKIGTGAVVAAGALVTKDVEPYTIVAGTPARVVRRRFNEKLSERLLKLAWWNYDLMDWINSGRLPHTSGLDSEKLSVLEEQIHSGHAPRLISRRSRLEVVGQSLFLSSVS